MNHRQIENYYKCMNNVLSQVPAASSAPFQGNSVLLGRSDYDQHARVRGRLQAVCTTEPWRICWGLCPTRRPEHIWKHNAPGSAVSSVRYFFNNEQFHTFVLSYSTGSPQSLFNIEFITLQCFEHLFILSYATGGPVITDWSVNPYFRKRPGLLQVWRHVQTEEIIGLRQRINLYNFE